MMRILAGLVVVCLVSACSRPSDDREEALLADATVAPSQSPDAAADSVLQFLLASAATDFHAHGPPTPTAFRNVHLGHVTTSAGETQYLVCGEFLPAEAGDSAAWMQFATIRTAPYEQLLGAQAEGVCSGAEVTGDGEADHSGALQAGYDALR